MTRKNCFQLFVILLVIVITGACNQVEEKKPAGGSIQLRSQYIVMGIDDVKKMVKEHNFYDTRYNTQSGFGNDFKTKSVEWYNPNIEGAPGKKSGNQSIELVLDYSTNLTWTKYGSSVTMTYNEALAWLSQLNKYKFAGYSDWRLPTLEEAASLIESKKVNKFYLSSLFSTDQYGTLTGDNFNNQWLWYVSFHKGGITKVTISERSYIRPVRSGISAI